MLLAFSFNYSFQLKNSDLYMIIIDQYDKRGREILGPDCLHKLCL